MTKRKILAWLVAAPFAVALIGTLAYHSVVILAVPDISVVKHAKSKSEQWRVICVKGYAYIYNEWTDAIAPKFDEDGKPEKCKVIYGLDDQSYIFTPVKGKSEMKTNPE